MALEKRDQTTTKGQALIGGLTEEVRDGLRRRGPDHSQPYTGCTTSHRMRRMYSQSPSAHHLETSRVIESENSWRADCWMRYTCRA